MSVFPLGTRVRKKSGSSWQGHVCGHYATSLTADGVCVESEREPGSVQNYPAHAMEYVDPATAESPPNPSARPETPQVNVCGETNIKHGRSWGWLR